MRRLFFLPVIIWVLVVSAIFAIPAYSETLEDNEDFARRVLQRLLSVCESGPQYMKWPPDIRVIDSQDTNAYATLEKEGEDKLIPRIYILNGEFTKIVKGNEHVLALTIAHELAHLVLGHHIRFSDGVNTKFTNLVISREDEYAADRKGMELLLSAGFSYRKSLKSFTNLLDEGKDHSSYYAHAKNHPSLKDRLARLDQEQAKLWCSMAAFENGEAFLTLEQYAAAETCYRKVTEEFPACAEAWANLGYAQLMQYCDALRKDDIESFHIGYIVCGAFYHRPASLIAQVRGVDTALWRDAVKSLKKATSLNQDLTLVKANLGIAYLLDPSGASLEKAAQYIREAAERVKFDEEVDSAAKAAVLVNAGVVESAKGDQERCRQMLSGAEEVMKSGSKTNQIQESRSPVSDALLYNRALMPIKTNTPQAFKEARELMEKYLISADNASLWWKVGYAQYRVLCTKTGLEPKTEDVLISQKESLYYRPVVSVKVNSGLTIALTQKIDDVNKILTGGQKIPIAQNLSRWQFPLSGIEVIGTDEVLGISLKGPDAPSLIIRSFGSGSETVTLRVGMQNEKLKNILKGEDFYFSHYIEKDSKYCVYRRLGFAAKIEDDKVVEFVIAQVPLELNI